MAEVLSARVCVVIQCSDGRDRGLALRDTMDSIRESDIYRAAQDVGPSIMLITDHDHDMQATFLKTLAHIEKSGCRYGIRLEDDVLVNKYLLENVLSWPALERDDFGVGWLFHSAAMHQRIVNALGPYADGFYAPWNELAQSQGLVVRADRVPVLIEGVRRNWAKYEQQQDRAIARAATDAGWKNHVHDPPLVEHNAEAHASLLAPDRPVVPGLHTTGGRWQREWRRSEA